MTTMYDSTNPLDIPEDAEAVAGYINGVQSTWPADSWARFTAATIKRQITTSAVNAGDTLDVENGDANVDQAPGWVKARTDAGEAEADLWLYCDLSNFDALKGATPGFTGGYWVADWTGEEHDVPGAVATQYANPSTSGGHYDLSHIAEPVPEPEPEPQPEPQPGGEFDVATLPTLQQGSSGDVVKSLQSLLNGRGSAGLAIDGSFGPATEQAVKNFQEVLHLTVDGIVGPQTWDALLLA